MNTQIVTLTLLVIVVLFVGIQAYQISDLKNSITGNAVNLAASSSGTLDMTSWTENEKMNYEMHGTIPSRAKSGGTSPSSSGMVGGC